MKIGYELTTEQKAKLSMTPRLIQGIRILQMNNLELADYIKNELLENPVIEESREETAGNAEDEVPDTEDTEIPQDFDEDYYNPDDYRFDGGEPKGEDGGDGGDNYYVESISAQGQDLREFLLEQLSFLDLNEREKRTGVYIIEEIDDNGYLQDSNAEIAGIAGVSEDEVEKVLKYIHDMEPYGVGARSIEECLEIQLTVTGGLTEEISHIIRYMLEDVAANRIAKIASELAIKPEEAQSAVDLIKSLEPKPGRSFAGSAEEIKYVVPDLKLEKIDNEYVISVNDSQLPTLRISAYYKELLLNAKKDRALNKYLNEKFNSAQWLIKNIQRRRETLFKVTGEILKAQRDFFDGGEESLKSLTLKQVANSLNMHESTVSRAINGKYIQTPEGVFELKYFFPSKISSAGDGEGLSSSSVKFIIKDVVCGEDPKKPYSDREIADLLKNRGIDISRRTVAKYREELGIVSSSKRRRY